MANSTPTNEQLLKWLEEFENSSDDTREGSRRIGRGLTKSAYSIPGTENYVLKKATNPKHNNEIIKDYIVQKQMSKIAPTETPILVNRPDKDPVLFQKKLQSVSMSDVNSGKMDDIYKKVRDSDIYMHDLHRENAGIDPKDLSAKIIDAGPFKFKDNDTKNNALKKARDAIVDRLSKLTKSNVYRGIAPYLLKGAAAGATAGFSLASEAADVASSGASPDMQDYWVGKGYSPEEAKLKAFKSGLTTGKGYSKIPGPYDKNKQYKEDVLMAEREGSLRDNYVDSEETTDNYMRPYEDDIKRQSSTDIIKYNKLKELLNKRY